MDTVKIIECPRDAWQGLPQIIPATVKAAYLLALVDGGVRHIDAVSFVSPKHVRQMADSEEVLAAFASSLPSGVASPEIIGIVVNDKGIEPSIGCAWHHHTWLPVFDFGLLPPRQCEYVADGIARTRRTVEKGDHGRWPRHGGLYFHGLRQSLR